MRALQRQPLQQRPALVEGQLPRVVAVEVQQVADPQLAAVGQLRVQQHMGGAQRRPELPQCPGERQLGPLGVGDPGPAALDPDDHPAAAEADL